MGAAIGLCAAILLAAPAPMRPINLNLPPPRPPAQWTAPANFLAPMPPQSQRPRWLAPWLLPDATKASWLSSGGRKGGGGGGRVGRLFGGGRGHGGSCHGGGHR